MEQVALFNLVNDFNFQFSRHIDDWKKQSMLLNKIYKYNKSTSLPLWILYVNEMLRMCFLHARARRNQSFKKFFRNYFIYMAVKNGRSICRIYKKFVQICCCLMYQVKIILSIVEVKLILWYICKFCLVPKLVTELVTRNIFEYTHWFLIKHYTC